MLTRTEITALLIEASRRSAGIVAPPNKAPIYAQPRDRQRIVDATYDERRAKLRSKYVEHKRSWREKNAERSAEIDRLARKRRAERRAERRAAEALAFAADHAAALPLLVALRLLAARLGRYRARIAQRARREQIGIEAKRAEWLRAQHARRARLREAGLVSRARAA